MYSELKDHQFCHLVQYGTMTFLHRLEGTRLETKDVLWHFRAKACRPVVGGSFRGDLSHLELILGL